MKAKTVLLFIIFICIIALGLVTKAISAPVYNDTMKVSVINSEVHKANVLIEFAELDSTDEAIVKEAVSESPQPKQKAVKLIEIIKDKDALNNLLLWLSGILTTLISVITGLTVLVKKVRSISSNWSPISWIEKLTGEHKTVVDGVKGTYKKVFVPDKTEINPCQN